MPAAKKKVEPEIDPALKTLKRELRRAERDLATGLKDFEDAKAWWDTFRPMGEAHADSLRKAIAKLCS